jgi:hypothetical protein
MTPTPPQQSVAQPGTSTTTIPSPPQENAPPETQATTPAAPPEIVPIFPSHVTILSDITNNLLSINSVPKSFNLTSGYAGSL